jgi:hypothetical protein
MYFIKRFTRLTVLEAENRSNLALILVKVILAASQHGEWHDCESTFERDHMARQEARNGPGVQDGS